jgi:hypothetical protein
MIMQMVNLGILLPGALITYKVLMLATNSESPIARCPSIPLPTRNALE